MFTAYPGFDSIVSKIVALQTTGYMSKKPNHSVHITMSIKPSNYRALVSKLLSPRTRSRVPQLRATVSNVTETSDKLKLTVCQQNIFNDDILGPVQAGILQSILDGRILHFAELHPGASVLLSKRGVALLPVPPDPVDVSVVLVSEDGRCQLIERSE